MSYFAWDIQPELKNLSQTECVQAAKDLDEFLSKTLGGQLLERAIRRARAEEFLRLFAAGRGNARADENVGAVNGRLDVLRALEEGLGLGSILSEAAEQKREA